MNDLSWTLQPGPCESASPHPPPNRPAVLVVGRHDFLGRMSEIIRDGGLPEREADGEAAARAALNRAPAGLIVLDGGLATPTDFSLCARLTALAGCPLIMVAAGEEESDRILALELGADDCVPATCRPRELLARIQAKLRRGVGGRSVAVGNGVIPFGEWRLDVVARQVLCPDGRWIGLGPSELMILQYLIRDGGRFTPAADIIRSASSEGWDLTENHLRVQISRLRGKLGPDSRGRKAILGIRCRGYAVSNGSAGHPTPASATNPVIFATKADAAPAGAR